MKIASRLHAYREQARARREMQSALNGAASPSHHEELLALVRHTDIGIARHSHVPLTM